VLGIGVGTPGVVDANGTVVEASNLGWHDVPLADLLTERLGHPTVVTNDAHAAALGELRLFETDADSLVLVELGEGVGTGLVLASSIHRGDHGAAGELGHVVVDPEGPLCRCGKQGCLETFASVPAIIRRAAGGLDPDSIPWTREAVAGVAGTAATDEAIAFAGRHLGAALAHVVGILDVTRIVVTAELEGADDALVTAVDGELRRRLLRATAEHVTVEATRIGPDLVLAGAGAAVLADQLGVVLR
jgi:predicted NBD/HSP70 family sugar kinase